MLSKAVRKSVWCRLYYGSYWCRLYITVVIRGKAYTVLSRYHKDGPSPREEQGPGRSFYSSNKIEVNGPLVNFAAAAG